MKKLLVIAMARSKKDAKEKIEDLSLTFAEHLMYLFLFDSKENSKHWRNELSAILNKVWGFSKVRGAKGLVRLSHAEVMDYLYETTWLGTANDRKETLRDFYRMSIAHNKKLKTDVVLNPTTEEHLIVAITALYNKLTALVLGNEFTRPAAEALIKEATKHNGESR